MDDKQAITHLLQVLEKYELTDDEKEAVKKAIGIMSWTTLRTGAVKSMREKRIRKRTEALR